MSYDDLTTALAAKFGIDGLVREDGICSFEIDGMIVSLVHVEEADALVLHGIVGDPPPEAKSRFPPLAAAAS